VSTDGGALLLRAVDGKVNLLGRLAGCFRDGRMPVWRQPFVPVNDNLNSRLSLGLVSSVSVPLMLAGP
jgi:hypothetical protein